MVQSCQSRYPHLCSSCFYDVLITKLEQISHISKCTSVSVLEFEYLPCILGITLTKPTSREKNFQVLQLSIIQLQLLEIFCKKVILKALQNSQEDTYARASFLIKLLIEWEIFPTDFENIEKCLLSKNNFLCANGFIWKIYLKNMFLWVQIINFHYRLE